jgi:hypothetical protein
MISTLFGKYINSYKKFFKIEPLWWGLPKVPELRKLRQEDHEFEASLDSKTQSQKNLKKNLTFSKVETNE